MRFFQDRTALITGASSGLGADFARQLAAEGCHLVLVARRLERLQNLQREIQEQFPVQVTVWSQDLARLRAADMLYDALVEKGLKADILINNAGFGMVGDFLDLDEDREEEMLALNMLTLTRLTKLFGRDMAGRGGGHILLVASIAAFQPAPAMASYAASKAYVQSFGEAVAYELRPYGVGVTVLAPGGVLTEFSEAAGQQLNTWHERVMMQSPEVVAAALNGLERGLPLVVPGLVNQAGVFANRLLPRRLAPRLAHWIMRTTLPKDE